MFPYRQACVFADDDYSLYLEWLQAYAEQEQGRVHAYACMTNHVHLCSAPTPWKDRAV